MNRYQELNEQIAAKRAEWMELYQSHREKGFSADELSRLQALNATLTDLHKDWEPLHAIEEQAKQLAALQQVAGTPVLQVPHAGSGGSPTKQADERRSPGQAFITSPAFKDFRPGTAAVVAVELGDVGYKTTLTTSAGFAPANNRMPDIIPSAQRIPVIEDYLPAVTTDERNSTSYMEQTTYTNNAAMRSEGAAAGESALAWTQRNQPIEVLSVTIPATDQQLADAPQVQALVDIDLRLMLDQQAETQILTGNGSTPNLQGILTKSGIQTQAVGGDDPASAIYKAMTKIRITGRARPSLAVLHPDNWQYIRLMKDGLGNFIWGPPSGPDPERIWGLPVLATDAETANTGLVLDVMYVRINNRQGVTVAVTNSHNDEFTKGIQRVRLDRRMNLEIRRAGAICTVTSMPT